MNNGDKGCGLVLLRDLFENFQEQETVNSKRLVWKHALVGFLFFWECIDTIKKVPVDMFS